MYKMYKLLNYLLHHRNHVIDDVEHKYCTVEKLSFPENYIIQMVYSIIKFCINVLFFFFFNV